MEETEQEKQKVKKGKKPKEEKLSKIVESTEEIKLSNPPEKIEPVEIVPEESKKIENLEDAGKSIGEKVENENFFDWLIKLILNFFKK